MDGLHKTEMEWQPSQDKTIFVLYLFTLAILGLYFSLLLHSQVFLPCPPSCPWLGC